MARRRIIERGSSVALQAHAPLRVYIDDFGGAAFRTLWRAERPNPNTGNGMSLRAGSSDPAAIRLSPSGTEH
jgi:hypothetical protein